MKRIESTFVKSILVLALLSGCVNDDPLKSEGVDGKTVHKESTKGRNSPIKEQEKVKKKQTYQVDERTGFVIDDGFEVVSSQCTVCHSAKLVTQNRGDREQWKSLIVWMQKTQGLWPFDAATESRILDYLSKHYGPSEAGRRPAIAVHDLPPKAPRAAKDEDVVLAQAQLKILKKSLMGTLKPAMKKGAENALNACNLSAPVLTDAASTKRIVVGRTSSALRNSKNKAPSWVVPLLRAMKASPDMPFLTVEREIGGKPALGYVEPIRMKPLCLKCHGTDVGAGVQAALRKHYPNDKALGYQAGDFRGVFWAEVNPE